MKKIPSGIEGFDVISQGGIPKSRTTLISGTPGSGKTIFCAQFLIGGILLSNEPGVYVTFEESPEDIINNMTSFGWDISGFIERGLWTFVDVSPQLDDQYMFHGEYDLSGLLIRIRAAIDKIKAKRIALDSIAVLFTRYPDQTIIRNEIFRLKSCLNTLDVTSLITSERYEELGNNSHYDVIDFVSDNVILLKNALFEEYRRRTIEIVKYRGASHRKGKQSFTIKDNKGMVVISFESAKGIRQPQKIRKSTGLPRFDEMIGGGFFTGSAILISGETGTGKTLLSLSMLKGPLQRKEKCLMINLEEGREQVLLKARNWQLDLEKIEEEGLFKLYSIYPESLGIEDLVVDIKSMVEEFSPSWVFLDSISALERITTNLTFRESLINLFLYLREMNIIGVFTTTTPAFSESFITSEKHISTLSDAIILLRFFSREGELTKGVSIMKMRDSDHSKHFIEYDINEEGIQFLDPIDHQKNIFR